MPTHSPCKYCSSARRAFAPMQQYTLIRLRNPQGVTHLVARQASISRSEITTHCSSGNVSTAAQDTPSIRHSSLARTVRLPGSRWRRPMKRIGLIRKTKPVLRHRRVIRILTIIFKESKRDYALFAFAQRVFARFETIVKIHVLSVLLPSKRSNPRSTPTHASCATSSALRRSFTNSSQFAPSSRDIPQRAG